LGKKEQSVANKIAILETANQVAADSNDLANIKNPTPVVKKGGKDETENPEVKIVKEKDKEKPVVSMIQEESKEMNDLREHLLKKIELV